MLRLCPYCFLFFSSRTYLVLINALSIWPNNSFTGRGRVTLSYRRPDGHAPVQWMFGCFFVNQKLPRNQARPKKTKSTVSGKPFINNANVPSPKISPCFLTLITATKNPMRQAMPVKNKSVMISAITICAATCALSGSGCVSIVCQKL